MVRVKKVQYLDLFNPNQVIQAPNKILDWPRRWAYNMREYVKENTKCRCKHGDFDKKGLCVYRNCRHSRAEHWFCQ